MLFKKLKKQSVLQVAALILTAAFVIVVGACQGNDIGGSVYKDQTPTAGDYILSDNNQTQGSVTGVTVKAKANRSPGAITVHYEGYDDTNYIKSAELPTEAGSYTVTIDVEAAAGWNAATGLVVGTLVISNSGNSDAETPAATDFEFENLNQVSNNIKAVVITPRAGKSQGTITVYYDGSQALPTAEGSYSVTFDVAAATGWKAATGLSAGNLNIGNPSNQSPVVADYDISDNLSQTVGSVTAVTVTAKDNTKSAGDVTVHYEGYDGTTYERSSVLPQDAGKYEVTFDVEAATGWNAASMIVAGILTIKRNPAADDFEISDNLAQNAGIVTAVTVTAKSGKSQGDITVKYANSTTLPQTAGTYTVTFDVAETDTWNAATGLSAGTLIVSKLDPAADDFDISGNLNQTAGSVTDITVTAKSGKSQGNVTVKYANSTTLPQAAGTYTVTFDVAATDTWNAASIEVGTLTITTPSNNANIRAVSGSGTNTKYGLYIGGMPGTSNGTAQTSSSGFSSTTITVSGNNPSMQTTRKAVVIVEDAKVKSVEFALTGFTNGSSITAGNLNLSNTPTWTTMTRDDDYTTPDTVNRRWTSAIGGAAPSSSGYRGVYVKITAEDGTAKYYRYVQYISTTSTNNVTRGELSALSIGGVSVITGGNVQGSHSKGIALGWWNKTVAPDLDPGSVTITAAQAASCAVTATVNQSSSGFSVSIAKISASQWPLLENSDLTFGYTGTAGTNPKGDTTFTNVQNGDYIIIRQNANTSDSTYGGLFTHTIIKVNVN